MSVSNEAKEISKVFLELNQFGFIVANFNTPRPVKHRSIQKLTDHIIIGKTGIHFIEVKLTSTKDVPKMHQIVLGKILSQLAKQTVWIKYWKCVSLEQAHFIFEMILNGSPDQKGERLGI